VLYAFTKFLVRTGLLIFFRKIVFENKRLLDQRGPLLLACNHPNSFLDALIIGSYFRQPVHFLARGDAFKKPFAKKILTALKVIPIYRLNEGKEYLALNDVTFERCSQILVNGGIVLIFSEGLCINQWRLRPLKKGTARIALNTWKYQKPPESFRILPVSLNYSSFSRFRKNVVIHLGQEIKFSEVLKGTSEGEQIIDLNKLIYARLSSGLLLTEEDAATVPFLLSNLSLLAKQKEGVINVLKEKQAMLRQGKEKNFDKLTGSKKIAVSRLSLLMCLFLTVTLCIPAVVGLLLHLPLYLPLNNFILKKTSGTVFYHSALFGALIIFYPLYVLLISIALVIVEGRFVFLSVILIMPFLAKIFLLWKDCLEVARRT
ncbi:MAG: 1-acyl-sn-glycerol-3-phosphate acyltransferase, partial [Bacteroidota bacterium]|nr:1-acyl-sn-glycerol-3-phosphate acyltransferase [Bacteroidota bacterium]